MKRKMGMEIGMENEETVEYEPLSVKELLTEMKDKSELIADLAYAAVIFDDVELSEEVEFLEEEMDRLMYQIRMGAMLAAREQEDARKLSSILQIASATEKISNAAGDIASLLKLKGELRPFLPTLLERSEEKIKKIVIKQKRGIDDIAIETGIRVIAIKRGRRWIYNPDESQEVKDRDVILGKGSEEGFEKLLELIR